MGKRNAMPGRWDGGGPASTWRTWLAIGATGFGGPAGQIAILHRELVERHRWLDDREFDAAVQFCTLLPGPEAQQVATYAGWRISGLAGGLLAGSLFVLPGAVLVTALAWLHAAGADVPLVAAAFAGTRPAVVALVVMAAWRIGRRALGSPATVLIAILALPALVAGLPMPAVLAAAAAWGWFAPATLGPAQPSGPRPAAAGGGAPQVAGIRPALTIAAGFATVWAVAYATVRGLGLAGGRGASLAELFTTTTLLSFGGAYTVVPWALEEGVARGWIGPVERADAVAAGEATPGPLILVVTFIGFLAGWKTGTPGSVQAGLEGAAVATLFAFIPSFALVLALAPVVRSILISRRPAAAVKAVGAVVVAAIAMLAVRLGCDAFLPGGRFDPLAVAVAAGGLAVLVHSRTPAAVVVAAAAVIGCLAAG